MLSVGTSRGQLVMFSFNKQQKEFRFETAFQPHPREESLQDNRFGSLKLYAEVWNMCLSPCFLYIATCSEDQTTRITRLDTGKLEYLFGGHSTAVTDVDWQIEKSSKREFLVTCADDCKVIMHLLNDRRKNSKKKWVLFRVFDSKKIDQSWHTLTYMKVVIDQGLVIVVSQFGFLYIWDFRKFVRDGLVFGKKVSFGSIEGLDVIPSNSENSLLICTASSDCTVGFFRLDKEIQENMISHSRIDKKISETSLQNNIILDKRESKEFLNPK